MEVLPAWITEQEGGYGFAEMVRVLFTDNNKLCYKRWSKLNKEII
jgi:hypothetical protein